MFYESVVRIADFKYRLNKIEPNVLEGLKHLINRDLKGRYDNNTWHPWRENHLWTLDIDDLYKTNMRAMERLWSYYFKVKKTKTYYFPDAI